MEITFISISGFFCLISGIALIVYWYAFAFFLPYRDLSTTLAILVENRNWSWINWLGVFAALAGLLGQAGIYVIQIPDSSRFAQVGFFVAVAGTTLLIGTMLWETILWPILEKHQKSLLDFDGPIYTSRYFLPFFIVSGLIYSVGYVLVGIGIVKSMVLPHATGYLLALGAPLFGFGSMFGKLQVYPRSIGITMLSVGLIWLGLAMF
jgi:hypothetical protein